MRKRLFISAVSLLLTVVCTGFTQIAEAIGEQ